MRVLLKCLAVLLIASNCFAAPDAQPKPTAPDPRLSQPVTIECTGMRLHSVLDKISERTGVAIRCGKNKDDWQVRDLPVFVAVKDMRLDKLFKDLTECTHTVLSRETVGDSISYRVVRNGRVQAEVDAYLAARHAAAIDGQKSIWDAVSKIKDIPDSKLKADPNDRGGTMLITTGIARSVSSVLSSLGPEARDRVLSGDTISLSKDSVPQSCSDSLRAAMQGIHQYCSIIWPTYVKGEPTEDVLDKGYMGIWNVPIGGEPNFYVYMDVGGAHQNFCMSEFDAVARYSKGENAPEPPDLPKVDGHKPNRACPAQDTDSPLWARKIKLEAAKGPQRITAADVMLRTARTAGLNIITEDFISYTDNGENNRLAGMLGSEVAIGAAVLSEWSEHACWRVDDDGKTIVGSSPRWIDKHRVLVPESVYSSLCSKAGTTGIDFEDALQLVDLTLEQADEWMTGSHDLCKLQTVTTFFCYDDSENKPLLALYYHLSPEDKALAASPDGLPLAKLDQKTVAAALALRTKLIAARFYATDKDTLDREKAFADPNVLRKATFKLARTVYDNGAKYSYGLHITADKDGQLVWLNTLDYPFPVYSPDRMAELAKKATDTKQVTK
jgi:hypothetical protein